VTERPDLRDPDSVLDEQAPAAPEEGATGPAAEGAAEPTGADPLEARVAELTSDLQRLQAEYVNYKRRVDRDRDLVMKNARFSALSALLPVLDAIDRAREHEELAGGFKAVAESLERVVAGEGLLKFGETGDEFDPRMHEALSHSHSPHVTTTTCDRVVQAGYRIGDRVVRPALVTVVDPEPGDVASPSGGPVTQDARAGGVPEEPGGRPEQENDADD
jgi:molecular chaperone GrpE